MDDLEKRILEVKDSLERTFRSFRHEALASFALMETRFDAQEARLDEIERGLKDMWRN